MLEYVHSVPGRLRVRTPLFRRNAHMAADARAKLRALNGVNAVDVNTATGSLVVQYDDRLLGLETLWDELADRGYVPEGPPSHVRPSAAPKIAVSDTFTETLSRTLMNTLAERSALALVRALL